MYMSDASIRVVRHVQVTPSATTKCCAGFALRRVESLLPREREKFAFVGRLDRRRREISSPLGVPLDWTMACTADALANATDVCAYARSACAETGAGIFGSYITLWHCEMDGGWGWFLPLSAWLIVLIYALGTTADGFLIPQA